MDKKQLQETINEHNKWLRNEGGERADLRGAYLLRADLRGADLSGADLSGADLSGADLSGADLSGAYLRGADLSEADLRRAYLSEADLRGAYLLRADLRGVDLRGSDLRGADLRRADLSEADLRRAYLSEADLRGAYLSGAEGLLKLMGVLPGNYYYKRFNSDLINYGYKFKVGLNTLPDNETFASDERVLCAYPGFHFASKSWCEVNYPERPYEALIKIPTKEEYPDIQINEPWATDGKASANAIIILKIWDTRTGEEVTEQFK